MTQSIAPVHFGGLEVHALDAAGSPAALTSWLLHNFELEERIEEPFSLMLTVSTPDVSLSAAGLVGGSCLFTFGRGDAERDVRGIVIKADTVGVVRGQLRLRLWVGPSLEILSLSRRMRVFQGMTAIEIVQALVEPAFEAYGGALDVERVGDMPLRVRDYCVQHNETDLQLVQRLLAEEGIAFSFCHDADNETMVLLPSTACLHSATEEDDDAPRPLQLLAREPDLAPEETLQRLEGSTRMRSASAEASIWDWKSKPPALLSARRDPLADDDGAPKSLARFGEMHEHEPYRPVEQSEGAPVFEQVGLEVAMAGGRSRIDDLRATGTSNVVGMTDGATFEVQHASPDLDGRYAVLTITHHAEFHDGDDGVANGQTASYSNHFTCHRYATVDGETTADYVPPRRPKPRATGPVTAIVVGPEDEEIHTDEHGRIKVRMHWDREGAARGDHETSCWVPVGQQWAGPGFGAVCLPRVGMEVVVSFIAGDPDRPMCTGVVYNGGNRPPYPLPDAKTRTVFRTASSPGGDGHNELSFEDAAGNEEVFIKAQRNLREAIGANQSTSVGADQSISVGQHRTKTVEGSETNTIAEDQSTTIHGVRGTLIEGSESTYIKCGGAKGKGDASVSEGLSQLLVEGKRTVWAKEQLVLEVGPVGSATTKVILTPTGIQIVAAKTFNITIGNKAKVDIVPEMHQTTAATIKSVAEASTLQMHDDVIVEASKAVQLSKGEGDACSFKLDGDATLKSADVTLTAGSTATLKGGTVGIEASKKASVTGKAGVAVDSTANVAVTAGGEASLKGTVVRTN